MSGEPENKKNQPENHQQAGLINSTNIRKFFNNPAKLRITVIVLAVLLGIGIVSTFFNSFRRNPAPSNEKVIKLLEEQRQEFSRQITQLQDSLNARSKMELQRQKQDSIAISHQDALIQSLTNFKPRYENLNRIDNFDKSALRRAFTEFKPAPDSLIR
jgi:hypothetical protein